MNKLGSSRSTAAVLLIPLKENWFAVTFGQGRYILQPWALEDGFGLRVALNSIGENQLRSIDKERFDANAGQARLQATRDAPARDFDLDLDRDLIRAVTGTPDELTIAKRVTGRDALGVTTRIEIEKLPELLGLLNTLHNDETYKRRFPWIEQIREIKSTDQIRKLNDILLDSIRTGDYSDSWIAPPEILNWADVRFFAYSQSSRTEEYTDIHWNTCLGSTDRESVTIEWLQKQRVFCYGDDNQVIASWPVFSCIYAEVQTDDGNFLLTSGRWYRIARDFVDEINQFYKEIDVLEDRFPIYKDQSEGAYNRRVAAESSERLFLMDQKLLYYGGGRSSVEFCDLFGYDGKIIHVKRYSGSKELSHLFAQAFVSAQALFFDRRFRIEVNLRLPESHKIPEKESFRPQQYHILLGIISSSGTPLDLPFFSKVTLRGIVRQLRGYGYLVSLAKIAVDELTAKKITYRRRGVRVS